MEANDVIQVLIWGGLWGGIGSLTNGKADIGKILYGVLTGGGVVLLFYLLLDPKDGAFSTIEVLIGVGLGLVSPYVVLAIKSKAKSLLGGGH